MYLKTMVGSLWLFAASMVVRTSSMFYSLIYGIPILTALAKTKSFKVVITGALVLFCFLGPFLVYLVSSHWIFCTSPPKSTFCHYAVPNIYSFVQTYFWTNGFLKFFRIYSLHEGLVGIVSFVVLVLTFTMRPYRHSLYSTGLVISLAVLALMSMLFMSVQSATRFYSTHPAFYVNLAWYLDRRAERFSLMQKLVLVYLICYNTIGCVLFPARMVWV